MDDDDDTGSTAVAPTLLSPEDQATVNDDDTLTWSGSGGPYFVEMAESTTFSNPFLGRYTGTSAGIQTLTRNGGAEKPATGQTYYWHVSEISGSTYTTSTYRRVTLETPE